MSELRSKCCGVEVEEVAVVKTIRGRGRFAKIEYLCKKCEEFTEVEEKKEGK